MAQEAPPELGSGAPTVGVIERVKAREAQRAVDAAKRLAELCISSDPHESVQTFLDDFAARRTRLEAVMQSATSSAATTGGAEPASGCSLDELSAEVASLEQSVAGAAYFLPPYDLRQATLGVNALKELVGAAVAARQPRKKFSFRQKAAPPPAAFPPSRLPATAGDGDGGSAKAARDSAVIQQQATEGTEVEAALQRGGGRGSLGRTIAGLRGEVVVLQGEQVEGQDFTVSDLQDCTLCLLGPLAALFIHGLRRCCIVTGPVAGATFMDDVQASRLYVATRQVRVHSASATDLYLRILSNPIIEHSTALRFAPYIPDYPGCGADLEAVGLDGECGKWAEVHDFGWLRAAQSPHWALLPEAERQAPPALNDLAAMRSRATGPERTV